MPWRWIVLLVLGSWVLPLYAIVMRHDRADSGYQVSEADFPQVFYLHTHANNKICMASLIARRWALTAAHCTDQTPLGQTLAESATYAVTIAGQGNAVRAMVLHPDYHPGKILSGTDLALLYLDQPVEHVTPLRLNTDSRELAQVMALMGWGYSGVGTTGRKRNDGRFRKAENQVEEAGQWLRFRFDDPRDQAQQALDLEGVPGLGDSGGPALWSQAGEWLLSGVAVGELEPEHPNDPQGRYGAVEIYERISRHYGWINGVIAQELRGAMP